MPKSAPSVSWSQVHLAKRRSSVYRTIFVRSKDKTNYLSNQTWAKCYHLRNKHLLKKTLDGRSYIMLGLGTSSSSTSIQFIKVQEYFARLFNKWLYARLGWEMIILIIKAHSNTHSSHRCKLSPCINQIQLEKLVSAKGCRPNDYSYTALQILTFFVQRSWLQVFPKAFCTLSTNHSPFRFKKLKMADPI